MIADKATVEQEIAAALAPDPTDEPLPGAFRIPLAEGQDPTALTDAGRLRAAHLRAFERLYVSAEAARLAWAARLDAGLLGPHALASAPFHLRHEGAADYLDDACGRLFGDSWRGADRLDRIAARLVLWGAQRRAGRGYMERPARGARIEDPDAAVILMTRPQGARPSLPSLTPSLASRPARPLPARKSRCASRRRSLLPEGAASP